MNRKRKRKHRRARENVAPDAYTAVSHAARMGNKGAGSARARVCSCLTSVAMELRAVGRILFFLLFSVVWVHGFLERA